MLNVINLSTFVNIILNVKMLNYYIFSRIIKIRNSVITQRFQILNKNINVLDNGHLLRDLKPLFSFLDSFS